MRVSYYHDLNITQTVKSTASMKCNKCEQEFPKKGALDVHYRKEHQPTVKNIKFNDGVVIDIHRTDGLFVCPCSVGYKDPVTIRKHAGTHASYTKASKAQPPTPLVKRPPHPNVEDVIQLSSPVKKVAIEELKSRKESARDSSRAPSQRLSSPAPIPPPSQSSPAIAPQILPYIQAPKTPSPGIQAVSSPAVAPHSSPHVQVPKTPSAPQPEATVAVVPEQEDEAGEPILPLKDPVAKVDLTANSLWFPSIADAWPFYGDSGFIAKMADFTKLDSRSDDAEIRWLSTCFSSTMDNVKAYFEQLSEHRKKELMTSAGCLAVEPLAVEWNGPGPILLKRLFLFTLRVLSQGFDIDDFVASGMSANAMAFQSVAYLRSGKARLDDDTEEQILCLVIMVVFDQVFSVEDYKSSVLLNFCNLLAWDGEKLTSLSELAPSLAALESIIRVVTARLDFLRLSKRPDARIMEFWWLLSTNHANAFAALVHSINYVRNWSFPATTIKLIESEGLLLFDNQVVSALCLPDLYTFALSKLQQAVHWCLFRQPIVVNLRTVEDDIQDTTEGRSIGSSEQGCWLMDKIKVDVNVYHKIFDDMDEVRPMFLTKYYNYLGRAFEFLVTALFVSAGDIVTAEDIAHLVYKNGKRACRNFYVVNGRLFLLLGQKKIVAVPGDLGAEIFKLLAFAIPFWDTLRNLSSGPTAEDLNSHNHGTPIDPPSLFTTEHWHPFPASSITGLLRQQSIAKINFDLKPPALAQMIKFLKGRLSGSAVTANMDIDIVGSIADVTVTADTVLSLKVEDFDVDFDPRWEHFLLAKDIKDLSPMSGMETAAEPATGRALIFKEKLDPSVAREHLQRMTITVIRDVRFSRLLQGNLYSMNNEADAKGWKVIIFTTTEAQAITLLEASPLLDGRKIIYLVVGDSAAAAAEEWRRDDSCHIAVVPFSLDDLVTFQDPPFKPLHIVHYGVCGGIDQLAYHCMQSEKLTVYLGNQGTTYLKPRFFRDWSLWKWLDSTECRKLAISLTLNVDAIATCDASSQCDVCIASTTTAQSNGFRKIIRGLAKNKYCEFCYLHFGLTRADHSALESCSELRRKEGLIERIEAAKGVLGGFADNCTCGLPEYCICCGYCQFGETPLILAMLAIYDDEIWRRLRRLPGFPAQPTLDWLFQGGTRQNGVSGVIEALVGYGILKVEAKRSG
ncbi:hypothetical protein TWF730_000006 [Orbilia blumenaviensis]|uniref:C2H2-type domain-containing protein n=1 Tax=Orbilia blumenaviensis TaxID=1796055 RepID=A0AAV9VKH1_9PEZI